MTLRLGLLGCGFVSGIHSRALRALRRLDLVDAAVVAACDADPARAAACAGAHGAELATTDPEALLAAVDAAWVCTPTSSHLPLVEAAAKAGVAVFCEKPLAPDLPGADALASAVHAAGIPAQVGLVLRTAPAYAALVDLVASGSLGRPMAAVLRDDQYFPVQGQYASTWRGDVAVAGGGTLLEHSIHDVDVLRWLLGEVVSVTGRTASFAGRPGIEDVAVATLVFASGATATLTSVWHQVLSRPSTRWLEVVCEHGIAAVEHEFDGPLVVTTSAGTERRSCPPPAWVGELPDDGPWTAAVRHYAPQSRAFVEALGSGRPPRPGLDLALAAHRVVDGIYRSAGAGGSSLPLPSR